MKQTFENECSKVSREVKKGFLERWNSVDSNDIPDTEASKHSYVNIELKLQDTKIGQNSDLYVYLQKEF